LHKTCQPILCREQETNHSGSPRAKVHMITTFLLEAPTSKTIFYLFNSSTKKLQFSTAATQKSSYHD